MRARRVPSDRVSVEEYSPLSVGWLAPRSSSAIAHSWPTALEPGRPGPRASPVSGTHSMSLSAWCTSRRRPQQRGAGGGPDGAVLWRRWGRHGPEGLAEDMLRRPPVKMETALL